jgi:hypothetical protein
VPLFRVVQPYGPRRDEWSVQSEHGSLEAAFAAIGALRAKMTKTGAPPDSIELIVVNEDGVRILRSSTH